MDKKTAMQEFKKMWLWLYQHPAHDKKYYVDYVARVQPRWLNDCPLCTVATDACTGCLDLWNNEGKNLCTDPVSPYSKWKATSVDEAHHRTWYAGEIVKLVM